MDADARFLENLAGDRFFQAFARLDEAGQGRIHRRVPAGRPAQQAAVDPVVADVKRHLAGVVLPPGADFLPKIHGPIPYLLGQLRKQPGIRVPPRDVLSRFNINDQSSRDEIPFTISGTMPNFTPEDRRAAIEACPEVKVRTSLGASFLTLLSFTFLSTSLLCSLSHHHLIILSLSTQKQQLTLVLFR